jgi:hypothetical protein
MSLAGWVKLTFEWGSEADGSSHFEQQEFMAESYELRGGAVVMSRVQNVSAGWYWQQVGVPIAGLTRWYVGEGCSRLEDVPL